MFFYKTEKTCFYVFFYLQINVLTSMILTTQKRQEKYTKTPKAQNKRKINKLALRKKNTHKTLLLNRNLKLTKLSAPVRTAHLCVLISVYNCGAQY